MNAMCRVTVEVDQDLLRDMRPDLDSMTAVRLWAQQLIDMHIQQMELENDETMSIEEARDMSLAAVKEEYLLPDRDMTPEELSHAIEQEIDQIYAQD